MNTGTLLRAPAAARIGLLAVLAVMLLAGCATTTERRGLSPLETVAEVDLSRYVGTWYEIASYPQVFQRRCTGTTATYRLRDDGLIDVENRCFKGSLEGREAVARGRARVPDPAQSAKLEVSFFGPFWGDYWVIDLGADYEYAVVGSPSRDFLWILSRTPTMDERVYEGILDRLRANGYTLDRLQTTVQPGSATAAGAGARAWRALRLSGPMTPGDSWICLSHHQSVSFRLASDANGPGTVLMPR